MYFPQATCVCLIPIITIVIKLVRSVHKAPRMKPGCPTATKFQATTEGHSEKKKVEGRTIKDNHKDYNSFH